MPRQPEGLIKDRCREIASEHGLLFWQIEGKGTNGVPDTLAGRASVGIILIEFKRPGREPEPQQWRRIRDLRNAGVEAWWADSVEVYRRLVGLDPGGYEIVYPPDL